MTAVRRAALLSVLAALLASPTAEAAQLVCLDPGHARKPNLTTERIGPGSSIRKIKDGGGTAGEARVVLRIARKTRAALLDRGYRVAMTRTGMDFTRGRGGNIDRARFCNRHDAALMLRIHADGSTTRSIHGVSTLYPAWHRGWTDDISRPSRRAARIVQRAVLRRTGAADRGLVARSDLTGFNWANVPVILVETGFMTNPAERRRLQSNAYEWRLARGLAAGAAAFASH
jgi:N-acetylmuramoyl-L-alanine amidase